MVINFIVKDLKMISGTFSCTWHYNLSMSEKKKLFVLLIVSGQSWDRCYNDEWWYSGRWHTYWSAECFTTILLPNTKYSCKDDLFLYCCLLAFHILCDILDLEQPLCFIVDLAVLHLFEAVSLNWVERGNGFICSLALAPISLGLRITCVEFCFIMLLVACVH